MSENEVLVLQALGGGRLAGTGIGAKVEGPGVWSWLCWDVDFDGSSCSIVRELLARRMEGAISEEGIGWRPLGVVTTR